MTTLTDIVNRALQVVGTRTTVTDSELATNSTNEAIQANLCLIPIRRQLLRMAPWDCGLKTANLTYISSVPGTPENTSPATTLWTPGQPTPPWAYEYQYPVDCLRACWIIPATQTGYAGGIPITTAGLAFGTAAKQRVILTNQEFATLVYVSDVDDPNVFDDLFIEAYVRIVGATIANALSGDKKIIKMAIDEANIAIGQARAVDANEGPTINDVTPDWIRIRGIDFGTQYSGPYTGFDWGGYWSSFA